MAKNETGGMPESMRAIMGWVLGLGVIAFILLILVIIFGNLQGNVGFKQDSVGFINETTNFTVAGTTPTTATGRINGVLSSVIIINGTIGTSEVIPANNYTITGVLIQADSTSSYLGYEINITATVSFDTQAQIDADSVILNYTQSATNTSGQFPTIGTILGIALLLLILIALLVFVIVRMMGVAGGSSSANLSTSGGSNSFGGSDRGFS